MLCVVCQDEIDDQIPVCVSPCGHTLCLHHGVEMQAHHKTKCPVCRTHISHLVPMPYDEKYNVVRDQSRPSIQKVREPIPQPGKYRMKDYMYEQRGETIVSDTPPPETEQVRVGHDFWDAVEYIPQFTGQFLNSLV